MTPRHMQAAASDELLYVLPRPDFFSRGRCGSLVHALGVVEGLTEAGLRVRVISGPGAAAAVRTLSRATGVDVGVPRTGWLRGLRWRLRLLRTVSAELDSGKDIGLVLVRYSVSSSFLFRSLLSRLRDRTWCFEVNSLAYNQYPELPLTVRRLLRWAETRVIKKAAFLYVVSTGLANDLGEVLGSGSPPIEVIPNAAGSRDRPVVDWDADIEHAAAHDAPVRFTYLGVLSTYNEFDVILRAFGRIRDAGIWAELHLYGDGPESEAVCRLAEGERRVFLHGRYDLAAILDADCVDRGTVLLLPSKAGSMARIGSPTKLFEYMSFGAPILASSVGQAAEVLQEGKTGVFYRAGDEDSCVQAMARIATEAELRRSLGWHAWRDFALHHTWTARMRQLMDSFQRNRRMGSCGGPSPSGDTAFRAKDAEA